MIVAPVTRRLFASPSASAADHRDTFGPRPAVTLEPLLRALERSGLTGRGGAGFPVHIKMAAVGRLVARGKSAVVVGNGSEGEPLSAKDRTLLLHAPHLVLDGLLMCAEVLQTDDVHLVITPESAANVAAAVSERSDAARIVVHAAAHEYVAGEASALVQRLGGNLPLPTDRRVRLAEKGLRRRPTLVQNVETLAHIGLIGRFGADWYRQVGQGPDAGTRLFSLSRPGMPPMVVEAESGVTIDSLLSALPPGRPAAFALVGGFSGTWIPEAAFHVPSSATGWASWGAAPGAGVVHVLTRGECGLRATADILDFLAHASAGQCGSCVNGLPAIAMAMRQLAAGQDARAELVRLSCLAEGRGACSHPDGSIHMLRSALTTFADDVAAHARGRCVAQYQEARA
ncbi:NADH-ubiquinone oxidoreductase-F iron-sulfur binding region domain-containing protein [Microbacterium sp. NPDC077663]|uniref:NADH-ubiquinone oxidoreductase-F iron-sulfur binding region domain-containing protein n=1 Tax=Microbacterium sp. NPDC077663 TaxID=3364189 RepID=UPI0037C5C05D